MTHFTDIYYIYSFPSYETLTKLHVRYPLVHLIWVEFLFCFQVKWYHNGEEVYSGIEGDESYSRITVKNMSAESAGKYKVVAENKVGSAEAEFTVIVKGNMKQ